MFNNRQEENSFGGLTENLIRYLVKRISNYFVTFFDKNVISL